MERIHIVISGRVQGVFFRASTVQEARRLGLSGWVKNRRDGRVEVTAEGRRDQLEKFLAWCRHGPPGASVTDVEVDWAKATGEFKGFGVTY